MHMPRRFDGSAKSADNSDQGLAFTDDPSDSFRRAEAILDGQNNTVPSQDLAGVFSGRFDPAGFCRSDDEVAGPSSEAFVVARSFATRSPLASETRRP
jgi:hypothetical protein